MSSTRTILVVDDADECAAMLETALSNGHVDVLRVTTAEDALRVLAARKVAAVVTDLQLPGMSGMELLTRLHDVPAVVVSAAADPSAGAQALAAGAAAFFAKPFSPGALRQKIEELLKE